MPIDLRKYGVLFLLLMILFLSAGLTFASQNPSVNVTSKDCYDISTDEYLDNSSEESVSKSYNSTDGEKLSADSDDEDNNQNISSDDNPVATSNSKRFSTNIEYEQLKQQYTPGITFYQVKVYDIYKTGETQTKKPLRVQLKLKIYTGNSYKIYTQKSNTNGLATFRIPNLAVGTHNVHIFVDGTRRGESSIKITQVQSNVTAPATYVKHNENNYFRINVLDSDGNPLKRVPLNVNVYTGKKFETYKIKTSNYGNANIQTRNYALGVHKIVIFSGNRNYKINKTTKIIVKNPNYGKIKLSFDSIKVFHKKSNYFTVKATNVFGDPLRNVAVKFFVYTDYSHKTYTVKTNGYGDAKIQTKRLSLGTHRIIILAGNINRTGYVMVTNKITSPKLVSLQYYPKENGEYYIKLKFNSQKFAKYQILKKTSGSFRTCSIVKATSKTTTYYEKVTGNSMHSYSVREIISGPGDRTIYSTYDRQGLKMLAKPRVSVEFQNLQANIKWNKIAEATKYIVYRKMGANGVFKAIATVNATKLTYSDVYYESADQIGSILNADIFVDPGFNRLFYTVRACAQEGLKTSSGLYDSIGIFHLESPAIVSLKNNKITWGKVANAEGYLILKMVRGVWKEIARINAKQTYTMSYSLNINKNSYYSVQAYAHDNKQFVYSGFDEGFSLVNYKDSNNRILYFGDSITYGTPYRSDLSKHIFSIPYRIAQLIGGIYYNPSIPGSTYHDLGVTPNGTNVENTNFYRYRITREVVDRIYDGNLPECWEELDTAKNSEGKSKTCIADYNIVVLSAGTNDYADDTELGDIDSNDTSTFHGALNYILEKIKNASKERVDNGKEAIKVVFVDLFYADKAFSNKIRNNRDTTPNHINLTLMDYQDALNAQYAKWNNSTNLTLYKFKTRDYNIVDETTCPYRSVDNLHFTKFIYSQYGNALAKFLLEEVF